MVISQQASSANPAGTFGCHPLGLPSSPSPEQSGFTTPIEHPVQHIPPAPCPVSALLVTNLPSVLFSQVEDLHPLLCPFGEIVNLEIRSNKPDLGIISVFVEYKTAIQAQEACDALHGQCYTSQPVKVEYVQPNSPDVNYWPLCKINAKTGLNPMAPPFLVQWKYCPDDIDATLCQNSNAFNFSDDGPIKMDRTSAMEAPAYYASTNTLNGLHGAHLIANRPHSAPTQYVLAQRHPSPSRLHFLSPAGFSSDRLLGPRRSTRHLPSFPSTSLRSSFIA